MSSDDLFDVPGGATDDDGIPRDYLGRYLLPDPSDPDGKPKPRTRATTFAKTIADTYKLDMWGLRMAIKGITLRPDLYALTAATPLDHKGKLDKLAEQAKEAAGAKVASSLGTALHAFAEQADRGQEPKVPDEWAPDMAAYVKGLEVGLATRKEWIERVVYCERYDLGGTFDRINEVTQEIPLPVLGAEPLHAGDLVINDLKTGRDLQYGWNEIAVQEAIYANSEWIRDYDRRTYSPMPKVRKDFALVTHVPVGKRECTVYLVDIRLGWQAAELCHRVRLWRKLRNLAYPIYHVEVSDGGPAPVELTWADRIRMASSDGELSRIRKEAMAQGQWTKALLALGQARQRELAS